MIDFITSIVNAIPTFLAVPTQGQRNPADQDRTKALSNINYLENILDFASE